MKEEADEKILLLNRQLEQTCEITKYYIQAFVDTSKVSELFGAESLLDRIYTDQFDTIEAQCSEL